MTACSRCGRRVRDHEALAGARYLCPPCERGLNYYAPPLLGFCDRCVTILPNVARCVACGAPAAAPEPSPAADPDELLARAAAARRRYCWSCGLELTARTLSDCPYCGADTDAAFALAGVCRSCDERTSQSYSFCPTCGDSFFAPCHEVRLDVLSVAGGEPPRLHLRLADLVPDAWTRDWDRSAFHVAVSAPGLAGCLVSRMVELPAGGVASVALDVDVVRPGWEEVSFALELARFAGDRGRERRSLFGRATLCLTPPAAAAPSRTWYRVPLYPSATLRAAALRLDGFATGVEFGPYVIDRTVLARAGLGVYRARALNTGAPVVLKVVHRDARRRLGAPDVLAALAAAPHPHVVRILAHGVLGGYAYLAQEGTPGARDLAAAWPDAAALPPSDRLRIGLDLLAGLAHLHARGIVHRDVKPANVLFHPGSAAQLLDFGIAFRRPPGAGPARPPDGFAGPPRYAAPEQLAGDPLDGRADLYAVGALLVELLAGRELAPAAHRANAAELEPVGLRAVLLRLLDPDPLRRFPDADTAAAALSALSLPAEWRPGSHPPDASKLPNI
ncbi:MAG: protein kinase [Planctomycetes bacterium]|nr:protein kinase [Planctomycetota bacterium]